MAQGPLRRNGTPEGIFPTTPEDLLAIPRAVLLKNQP